MKKCIECNFEKPNEEFHKNSRHKDKLQSKCKECNNKSVRQWQKKNDAKYEAYWKERDIQFRNNGGALIKKAKKYGITVEQLQNLLESANNVCQICGRAPRRWLVVDHCHTSSKVRGILCEKCNQSLGLMEDNVEYLQAMIDYLKGV